MGRSSKLQLARRSAYCRRADVLVRSKRVWGFDTMLRTCLVVDIIEYPTPSPSQWRAAWRCAGVITFVARSSPPSRSRTSTLTVGRGGERPTPPGQHRPATSPYIEIEHLAQIPPNLRSRQPNVNGRLAATPRPSAQWTAQLRVFKRTHGFAAESAHARADECAPRSTTFSLIPTR